MSNSITITIICTVLIPQLGAHSYRKRERATQALERLMPLSIPYLEKAQESIDMETADRAGRLVHKWYQATAKLKAGKALPTNYPRLPWLDQLPLEVPNRDSVVHTYLNVARAKCVKKGAPDWQEYRYATKLYLEDLFAERSSAQQVQPLLDRMRDAELRWIRTNGSRYNPPIKPPKGWK